MVMVTQRPLITMLMVRFLDMRWRRAGLMMTRLAQRRVVQTPAIMMRTGTGLVVAGQILW